MPPPYEFGAINLINKYNLEHLSTFAECQFIFAVIFAFIIVSLNITMIIKIRSRKILTSQVSSQKRKAERTLTGTMVILLIPSLLYLGYETCNLFQLSFRSEIVFIAEMVIDLRTHLVTFYFYFTHPVFKKAGRLQKVSVHVKNTFSKSM
uniref:G_PROTEIN_RECEP_F1_2 domain-containing protein n=1 Tax=Caenorhabditis tropicalis TaxID=1561998 RepID=A0A1I7TW20_9PELO